MDFKGVGLFALGLKSMTDLLPEKNKDGQSCIKTERKPITEG